MTWEQIVNQGVSFAVLVAMGLIVLVVGRWLKPWLEKAFTAHIKLIEALQKQGNVQTASLNSIAQTNAEIAQKNTAIVLRHDQMMGELVKQTSALEVMSKATCAAEMVGRAERGFLVTKEAAKLFLPLMRELKSLAGEPANLKDSVMLVNDIQTRFGGWLQKNVCPALGIDLPVAVAMAKEIARERRW